MSLTNLERIFCFRMLLAKVANSLTTIWHNYRSLFINPNTHRYFPDLHNSDQDSLHWGPPDFSEFKDPWENYSEPIDPVSQNLKHQIANSTHYYGDSNAVYHEPFRLLSHDESGSEAQLTSLTSCSLSSDNRDSNSSKSALNQKSYPTVPNSSESQPVQSNDKTVCRKLSTDNHHTHTLESHNIEINSQKQTDSFPNSSAHTSNPLANPNNVTTQSNKSASPCIDNANVSSL